MTHIYMLVENLDLVNPDTKQCIKQLQAKNNIAFKPLMQLEFRRDFCLEDALRHSKKMKFDPLKELKLYFQGDFCWRGRGRHRRTQKRILEVVKKKTITKHLIGISNEKVGFQPDVITLQVYKFYFLHSYSNDY